MVRGYVFIFSLIFGRGVVSIPVFNLLLLVFGRREVSSIPIFNLLLLVLG